MHISLRQLTALTLALGTLTVSALDRGGLTYDFKAISDARFAPATEAANLLTNGDFSQTEKPDDPLRWKDTYCFLHDASVPDDSPIRKNVRKQVRWTVQDGVATVTKLPALLDACEGNRKLASNASGAYTKSLKLPHTLGGTYKVDFDYRMNHTLGSRGYLLVSLYNKPPNRNLVNILPTGELMVFNLSDSGQDWNRFSREIQIPPAINYANIVIRIDGIGRLDFKNVRFTACKSKEDITVKLAPHGFLNQEYAVSQHQAAVMTFVWKKNRDVKLAAKDLDMVLTMPKGYDFLDTGDYAAPSTSKKLADGGTEIRYKLKNWGYLPQRTFNHYLRMSVMVRTDTEPGTRGLATLRIEKAGKTISNLEPIRFLTIPTITAPHTPKRYANGFYFGGIYLNFNLKESHQYFAQLFRAAGAQWIAASPGKRAQLWRDHGIKYITPEMYYVSNGYSIGTPDKRPEADRFKFIGENGQHQRILQGATCPAAVYEKRPYYANDTTAMIRNYLKGCDGLWGNWEPFMFAGKGCMCDTCRDNFARFVGVPLEQMKREWPQELAIGKKYHDQIVRFRSLEHAKLVKTIDQTVIDATGGKKSLGFIPGVAWDQMASSWRKFLPMREALPNDYAASLRWIDPWGPYPCWDTQQPYGYRKNRMLAYFISAKDVRAQVNKDYPVGQRPKLMAFPHGLQVTDWATQPEHLLLGLNAFFFNGYESSIVYAFPKGYDNRYWQAFNRAVETSANYEDFVWDGQRIDDRVRLTPVPEYAAPCTTVTEVLPDYKKVPLLQVAAYELDGRVIAAIFNFWQKGEAFFDFQLQGLEPKRHYVVLCEDDQFAPSKNRHSYTGAQLAQGIRLHAGLSRCAVYKIVPGYSQFPGKKLVTRQQLDELYQQAQPLLKREADLDHLTEKLNNPTGITPKNLNHAAIDCKVGDKAEKLSFSSGDNAITFSLKNMSVLSWKVKNKKLIVGEDYSGLGTVAFWEPAWQPKTAFRLIKQEPIGDGFRLVGDMQVTNSALPLLEKLKVIQTFDITRNCTHIKVTTTLENTSGDEMPKVMDIGFRYHCFPLHPATKDGCARLTVNGKTYRHTRNFKQFLFQTGDHDFSQALVKLFGVQDPTITIDHPQVNFSAPSLPSVTLTLSDAKDFGGFAIWDAPTMECATFEPCFKKTRLLTKQKITYSMTVSATEN